MSEELVDLIERIRRLPNCKLQPPAPAEALVAFEQAHAVRLPDDLREFLLVTDGLELFGGSDYPLSLHGIRELQRSNMVIVGEPADYDRSFNWFVIANDLNGDYMSIDLAPARLGRCYDSYFDRHASPGNCPVIAYSFTDFLGRAVENQGQHWWWLRTDFPSLGDAYDD